MITEQVECPSCKGKGSIEIKCDEPGHAHFDNCQMCGGSGKMEAVLEKEPNASSDSADTTQQ